MSYSILSSIYCEIVFKKLYLLTFIRYVRNDHLASENQCVGRLNLCMCLAVARMCWNSFNTVKERSAGIRYNAKT